MRKNIAKNYMYNMTYEVLKIIVPILTTPYLARVLGAENIGIYSYTLSIASYFILFGSLGIYMYGQREIAYVQENKYERSKIFYEIVILRCMTLAISLIVFYFCFCINGEYSIYYKIIFWDIFAAGLDIGWFFQGIEEFKKIVIRNTFVKVIGMICIFLFVKKQNDLYIYYIIFVLTTLLGNISFWLYIPKYTKKIDIKDLKIFRHIIPNISLFIPQIALQVYTVLDKTMIGMIISEKSEVGYYEQAEKIIQMLLTIVTSFIGVIVPRAANSYANGEKQKLKEYMNSSFSVIMMLAFPVMFGLISISEKFVPIFYGEGYDKVSLLINIMSPTIVIVGISNIIGSAYLIPTKKDKKYTSSIIIGAVVNFILNAIVIKKYSSEGASVATVIAEFMVTSTQLILVKEDIKIKEIFKMTYKYFIMSIIIFIVSLIIGSLIKNSIISIVIQFIISCLIYFSGLMILKDKFVLKICNKIVTKM